MSNDPTPLETERADGATPPEAREESLLTLGLAVQAVGIYGASHPSAQEAVAAWFKQLAAHLRLRGTFALGTDGRVALVNGTPYSTTNPVVLSLLRRLHMTRAGELEFLSGLRIEDAALLADFLAAADEHHLADDEHSLTAWVERHGTRHLRIKQLKLREVKEGDRIVASDRLRADARAGRADAVPAPQTRPGEVASWIREFRRETGRANRPAQLPAPLRERIVSHLRGVDTAAPEEVAELIALAAENAAQLAELILKISLVQQEIMQRASEPIGNEVVACIRSVLDALRQAPESQFGERWAYLARTLAAMEACILEQLQRFAGGTEQDAEIVRTGVRAMQHDLEGEALKREYEQQRSALAAVERRIERFFKAARSTAVPSAE